MLNFVRENEVNITTELIRVQQLPLGSSHEMEKYRVQLVLKIRQYKKYRDRENFFLLDKQVWN